MTKYTIINGATMTNSAGTYTDLAAARAALAENGGWLLDLGDGAYLVTDDPGTVHDMRGAKYMADCEAAKRWDETTSSIGNQEVMP